jgi:hypothetical protein
MYWQTQLIVRSTPPSLVERGRVKLLAQRLAAQQSRDDRHLALNGKALRTIVIAARKGASAGFGGALRHPFGLEPFIILRFNLPQPGVSIIRAAPHYQSKIS